MASKIPAKVFNGIESGLVDTLTTAIQAYMNPIIKKVISKVTTGNFSEAVALVNGMTYVPTLTKCEKYIDFSTASAFLFGVSRLTNPKDSTWSSKEIPKQDNARKLLINQFEYLALPVIKNQILTLIAQEEVLVSVQKSAKKVEVIKPFVSGMNGKVSGATKDYALWLSSLHTSRLSAWGFTLEAEVLGMEKYAVSEQLDGRTCPVCSLMHGRVFSTATAKSKLASWLEVDDVADLKTLAPWPKQDKESVKAMSAMTSEELASKGWDTPPYHPLCRGLLVHVNDVPLTMPEPANDPTTQFITDLVKSALTQGQLSMESGGLNYTNAKFKMLAALADTADSFETMILGMDGVSTASTVADLYGVAKETLLVSGDLYVEVMWPVTGLIATGTAPLVSPAGAAVIANGSVLGNSEVVLYALNNSQPMVRALVPAKEYWQYNKI